MTRLCAVISSKTHLVCYRALSLILHPTPTAIHMRHTLYQFSIFRVQLANMRNTGIVILNRNRELLLSQFRIFYEFDSKTSVETSHSLKNITFRCVSCYNSCEKISAS